MAGSDWSAAISIGMTLLAARALPTAFDGDAAPFDAAAASSTPVMAQSGVAALANTPGQAATTSSSTMITSTISTDWQATTPFTGLDGNDTLLGDQGADVLFGDEGDDTIFGGLDNDQFYGGSGNDWLWGGGDKLDGEVGHLGVQDDPDRAKLLATPRRSEPVAKTDNRRQIHRRHRSRP